MDSADDLDWMDDVRDDPDQGREAPPETIETEARDGVVEAIEREPERPDYLLCEFCEQPINTAREYWRLVTGWVPANRKVGGANRVMVTNETPRIAHRSCVEAATRFGSLNPQPAFDLEGAQ